MANVLLLVIVVLMAGCVLSIVQRRRRSFVPQRGTGIGADLGVLSDRPRVRVRTVTIAGPDRVRLTLASERGPVEDPGLTGASDIDLVVLLREDEPGFELLHEWQRAGSSLAMVVPPDSRLLRLRSVDDLQPLTLHRID